MAPNLPARIIITGRAVRIEPAKTKGSDSTPPQDCARVMVLTDGGGFLELYYEPEVFRAAPATPGDPIYCYADHSSYVRQSGNGRPYAFDDYRFIAAVQQATDGPALTVVTDQESPAYV